MGMDGGKVCCGEELTYGGSLLVNVCILFIIKYNLYEEVVTDGEGLMPQKDR